MKGLGADLKTVGNEKMRVRLSTLWIFAMFNYLYADVMSLMDPVSLRKIMSGTVGAVEMTPGFLLGAAILMETAIAMVLISRLAGYRFNRWANVVAGVLHTVAVIMSMVVAGLPKMYYLVFVTVELACTCYIVWCALRWRNPESITQTAAT